MGRALVTTYRILLVVISCSALILSILSTTSCAFIDYDHQYKSEAEGGRYLQEVDAGDAAGDTVGDAAGDTTAVDTSGISVGGDVGDMGGNPTGDGAAFDVFATEAPAASPAGAPQGAIGDGVSGSPGAVPAAAPAGVPKSSAIPTFKIFTAQPTKYESAVAMGIDVDEGGDYNYSMYATDDGDLEDGEDDNATTATSGSSPQQQQQQQVESTSTLVSGSAGLFCNEEKTISDILWGSSVEESEKERVTNLENEIAKESDNEESEGLARNGALVACVFGFLVALVLFLECLFGVKFWCERWIVAVLGGVACICQGVTLLMFDSQRYCDGNIVHEITNGAPCTIGTGAAMSIAALVLYFVTILMACRVPDGEAYGLRRLCCKKRSSDERGGAVSTNDVDDVGHGGGGSLMGGKASGGGNATFDGRDSDAPHWITKEQDENEIL